jgi:hypothetical protein
MRYHPTPVRITKKCKNTIEDVEGGGFTYTVGGFVNCHLQTNYS